MTSSVDPVLLAADNFTPITRTPWGGSRLLTDLKASCPIRTERATQRSVGESWEISVEPDFPAELAENGEAVSAWLARHGRSALGEEAERGRTATALLVKLLDTAEPLSLQIHPADTYAALGPDEAGKPESWYVVHAEPGAGLYLGFEEGVTRSTVEAALRGERPFLPLLHFVPVEVGDFFRIDAGTPHAIGAGLTLVEPQHVLPGRRGVTYRYWDWDRRYNSEGQPDPAGKARALQVEDALAVTRWDLVAAPGFAASTQLRAGPPAPQADARLEALCGPSGGLQSPFLQVWRLHGHGRTLAPAVPLLRGLSVLQGSVSIPLKSGQKLEIQQGRSALLPAQWEACELQLDRAHAIVTSVV